MGFVIGKKNAFAPRKRASILKLCFFRILIVGICQLVLPSPSSTFFSLLLRVLCAKLKICYLLKCHVDRQFDCENYGVPVEDRQAKLLDHKYRNSKVLTLPKYLSSRNVKHVFFPYVTLMLSSGNSEVVVGSFILECATYCS